MRIAELDDSTPPTSNETFCPNNAEAAGICTGKLVLIVPMDTLAVTCAEQSAGTSISMEPFTVFAVSVCPFQWSPPTAIRMLPLTTLPITSPPTPESDTDPFTDRKSTRLNSSHLGI